MAFSHVGSMLFIPQNFPNVNGTSTAQLCAYHCGPKGLKPWIHPSVVLRDDAAKAHVCVASDQTLYVTSLNQIYRVALNGAMEHFCGGQVHSDGTGGTAGFSSIRGIVAGPRCMFVVDGHCIRSVSYTGVVVTIAGHHSEMSAADGAGCAARFRNPRGICLDHCSGVIYVTEDHKIRAISPPSDCALQLSQVYRVSTVAGTDNPGFLDGIGSAAIFNNPQGIALVHGFLFVCDTGNHCIRRIAPNGAVSVIAGCASISDHVDATVGVYARFSSPAIICAGDNDSLFIGSTNGGCIRRLCVTDLTALDAFGDVEPLCGYPSDIQNSLHSLSSSRDLQQLCDWTIHASSGVVFACSTIIKLRCPALASRVSSAAEQHQICITGISREVLQMLVDYIHSDLLSMPLETKEDFEHALELLKSSAEFALPRLKIAVGRRLHRFLPAAAMKRYNFVLFDEECEAAPLLVSSFCFTGASTARMFATFSRQRNSTTLQSYAALAWSLRYSTSLAFARLPVLLPFQ
jgi:hypothetical protein